MEQNLVLFDFFFNGKQSLSSLCFIFLYHVMFDEQWKGKIKVSIVKSLAA